MSFTTLVNCDQLAEHLGSPTWVVVDCRFNLADPAAGEEAYTAGHIPGAHYAHLDHDLSGPITPTSGRHPLPDATKLAQRLGQWGITEHTQVVAYDDAGGAFAARLWWLLRWLGHARVAVLDGGFSAWTRGGYSTSIEVATPRPGVFVPTTDPSQWVTSAALEGLVAAGSVQLIDARDPERFRGEVEPIDPVAGHIPGAINVPFKQNLNSDGTFQSPDALRDRFAPVIGSREPETVVHMCGSGVTACHNVLAMEHAGLGGTRLYAGSWSEWIRDGSRPVASGQ
jgi:thiosulfate/3-mercaptopyruvate sulfurtransferase